MPSAGRESPNGLQVSINGLQVGFDLSIAVDGVQLRHPCSKPVEAVEYLLFL